MKNVNFLRPEQRDELKADIASTEQMLSDPSAQLNARGAAQGRLKKLKTSLEEGTPPPLSGAQKDKVAKLRDQLIGEIQVGMPSHEEMRRKPAGAVDKFRRHDKANKRKMILLKKAILALAGPDCDDIEIANLEQFRPRTSSIGMHSAEIGKDQDAYSFPSEQFKHNYDRMDWDVPAGRDLDLREHRVRPRHSCQRSINWCPTKTIGGRSRAWAGRTRRAGTSRTVRPSSARRPTAETPCRAISLTTRSSPGAR